jgi:MarR family transcriptional regulator, lower aerobic nicotinate degradation pathway regulator
MTAPVIETAGYVLEDQAGFQLRRAHQRASAMFDDVFAGWSVTPTQFAALAKLDDQGPMSQSQLGRLTFMDPATIFSVVGRLVKRGWVAQEADGADGRRVVLRLTSSGADAVGAMKRNAADVTRRILAPLDPREAALLMQLLRRIS